MPTPSDGTATVAPSYDEQVRKNEEWEARCAAEVKQQKALHETVTQSFIPNKGVPAVSGDCVLEEKYESESERASESEY